MTFYVDSRIVIDVTDFSLAKVWNHWHARKAEGKIYISRISVVFSRSELPYLDLSCFAGSTFFCFGDLTLLHSERPKLYAILAFLSAIWLSVHEEQGWAKTVNHLYNDIPYNSKKSFQLVPCILVWNWILYNNYFNSEIFGNKSFLYKQNSKNVLYKWPALSGSKLFCRFNIFLFWRFNPIALRKAKIICILVWYRILYNNYFNSGNFGSKSFSYNQGPLHVFMLHIYFCMKHMLLSCH